MTAATDGRHQRAELHRESIVAAAGALIAETGSVQLATDQLAERAGVSRRTVFNHFTSLDAIVTEVVARGLGEAIDELVAASRQTKGDREPEGAFGRLAAVFQDADLLPQLSFLWSVLSVDDAPTRRYGHLIDDAFDRLRELLVAGILEPDEVEDTFDLELLATLLMNGVAFVAQRWCEQTGGVVDDESRALWSASLSRMIDRLGRGYRRA